MSKTAKSVSSAVITNLQHHFLVAMPNLHDEVFDKTVIYICNHDGEEGAMGVVVNQPMLDVSFDEIAGSMGIESEIIIREPTIYQGGPVEHNRGFVVHSDDYKHDAALHIGGHVSLSATADIVNDIATGKGPCSLNFCLGYAGWQPGQLEEELAHNDWLVMPADERILFEMAPEQRYQACMMQMGANSPHFVDANGVA